MKYEVVALFFLNQPDGKFRLVTFNVRGIVLLVGTPILQYLKRDNNINRWVDVGPILGRHDHVGPLLPPTPVLAGVPGWQNDVIKWKYFPRYWPFVRGIHRSPVNSPHKGQWLGALMLSLICVWINGWVNNREAGDLRRYRAHYDVSVMGGGGGGGSRKALVVDFSVCDISGFAEVSNIPIEPRFSLTSLKYKSDIQRVHSFSILNNRQVSLVTPTWAWTPCVLWRKRDFPRAFTYSRRTDLRNKTWCLIDMAVISWPLLHGINWCEWGTSSPLSCRDHVSQTNQSSKHYNDVIMGVIASQITSLTIVYSIVYSDADQRKHQSSALLVFVRGIHRDRWIPRKKGPVTRKMFPFDDVIMGVKRRLTGVRRCCPCHVGNNSHLISINQCTRRHPQVTGSTT